MMRQYLQLVQNSSKYIHTNHREHITHRTTVTSHLLQNPKNLALLDTLELLIPHTTPRPFRISCCYIFYSSGLKQMANCFSPVLWNKLPLAILSAQSFPHLEINKRTSGKYGLAFTCCFLTFLLLLSLSIACISSLFINVMLFGMF